MELKFLINEENKLLYFFEHKNVLFKLISLILKTTDPKDNICMLNQSELAWDMRVTIASTSKCLTELIKNDIIKKVRNGVYMLNPDICLSIADTDKSILEKRKIYQSIGKKGN